VNEAVTILDFMRLWPQFEQPSWRPWKSFLSALFGLPMGRFSFSYYTECTGRTELPTEPFSEATVICGRRSGKSQILALTAVYLAVCRPWADHLAHGEQATIACVCVDRRQARTILRYIIGLLRAIPAFSDLVANETQWSIALPSRSVVIEVHTASFRVVRGYSLAAALVDEAGFFWADEGSAQPDVEIVRALRPGLLSLRPAGSLMLVASSPYAKRGVLWDAYKRYYAKDDAPTLVWKAPTLLMNSTIPVAEIDKARVEDPDSALSEYDAEFRSDVSVLLDRAVIEAAVMPNRFELPPNKRCSYYGFVDPSGGSSDSMCLAICHGEDRNGQRIGVLDVLREARPPFNADEVVSDFAKLLKEYGLASATGDRYGGLWPSTRFEANGIRYEPSEEPKSALYLSLLPLINAGRVELLDNQRLVAQLCSLERRTGRGTGRDVIDSPPHQHDDLSNVCAGGLTAVSVGHDFLDIWLGTIGKTRATARLDGQRFTPLSYIR
jgi:hypothetical protein